MNKLTLTVLLALLVAVPLAVRAATAATTEEALRARVKSFNDALLKEDYDGAVRVINPDTIELVGRGEMKKKLNEVMSGIIGLNALVNRRLTGFTIRRVTIDKDKTTAIVQLIYYSADRKGGGNRQQFPGEQTWTFQDKAWYWLK